MKDYRQFIKQLPNNTIVVALGDFNPPTTAHELLVKTVQVVSEQKGSDHVIFTANTESLQEDKKHQFLKMVFPKTTFMSLGESFFSTVVKKLNEKYKNIIIIAGADQFDEFKTLKESSTVEVISIGTKDPDADFPKMKQYATKGIYEDFKKLLPSTVRDIDGKRLMNEMRVGMQLEPIKEQLNLVKDKLREKYFRGEIFNVGQLVESNGQQFEIVKRGSNHLLVKDQAGELVSKWITDVKEIKEGVIQSNGTDKIETNAPEQASTKQDKKPAGKVKGFLTFYNYDDKTKNVNEETLEEGSDYNVTISHHVRGEDGNRTTTKHDYTIKNALSRKHAKNIAMNKHSAKVGPLKPGHSFGTDSMATTELKEGKMGQIHADIEDHIGKHVADYKANGGAEHLGHQTTKTAAHISKLHGIEQKHAQKLVNQYVDSKLNEETIDEGLGRGREDDEYHVPDPVTRTHKVGFHVSKTGVEKHHRTVTVSNSTKTPEEAKSLARAHLEKQGYTIHEETKEEQADRKKQLKRFADQVSGLTQDRPGVSTENTPATDPFFKEEFELSDSDIESMIEEVSEEELLALDEHTEWDLVYEDTEEIIPPHPEESKMDLMEVLSRSERIKGKIRLRKSQAKRDRSTKINIHRHADTKTINKRARRLAIKMIKKRMLRGRNPAKVSVGDKERIEKSIHKNKALVDRVAQKLIVRVRKVEKSRLSKGKVKKGTAPAVF